MKLTTSVELSTLIKRGIDASHNTHDGCRGHTGEMMSLGKGAVLSYSRKQKLNTNSSTEREFVVTDDGLTMVLWSLYFIKAQGYDVTNNILMQDNKSTILLETNSRKSSSKRTKYIKARYFFIKDKVDKNKVEIQYCPTEIMWADILNKPKQGKSFREFRSELMNVPLDCDDDAEPKVTPIVLSGYIVESVAAIGLTSSLRRHVSPVSNAKGSASCPHCRSVLGNITKQPITKSNWRSLAKQDLSQNRFSLSQNRPKGVWWS